jgi:hypothetical protein
VEITNNRSGNFTDPVVFNIGKVEVAGGSNTMFSYLTFLILTNT